MLPMAGNTSASLACCHVRACSQTCLTSACLPFEVPCGPSHASIGALSPQREITTDLFPAALGSSISSASQMLETAAPHLAEAQILPLGAHELCEDGHAPLAGGAPQAILYRLIGVVEVLAREPRSTTRSFLFGQRRAGLEAEEQLLLSHLVHQEEHSLRPQPELCKAS